MNIAPFYKKIQLLRCSSMNFDICLFICVYMFINYPHN